MKYGYPEEFEDTKGVIRIRTSKNRQHNGQKKKIQKEKQRSRKHTHKTKDRVKRTQLNTDEHLRCSESVGSSCSTSDKSWMRKRPGSVHEKWNIFVIICDTDIPTQEKERYMCVIGISIDFPYFVVFVYWILQLFQQCGIFAFHFFTRAIFSIAHVEMLISRGSAKRWREENNHRTLNSPCFVKLGEHLLISICICMCIQLYLTIWWHMFHCCFHYVIGGSQSWCSQ